MAERRNAVPPGGLRLAALPVFCRVSLGFWEFNVSEERKIVLGMPGYGKSTAAAGLAFWHLAVDGMRGVECIYRNGSLLAANFNQLWCHALNLVHRGERVDYFAMLHDDIGPEKYWLDLLITELEEKQLDVLGVVVPIKDRRGMTSIALARENDPWVPWAKLSLHDVYQLPETFTSDDVGRPLLLNTGCWVMRWNQDICRRLHFEINDRIVFNRQLDCYQSQTEPEDWNFSRQLHEVGSPGSATDGLPRLRIGATRKVRLEHTGEMKFTNDHAWGTDPFDTELMTRSPIPDAFPHDVKGWLDEAEGRRLSELARDKRVLEIGSYCGRSTVCLARTATHVTAVDFFDGPEVEFYGDYVGEFDASLQRHGVAHKVYKCHPTAEIPLPRYDLAFIDGAHDYQSVMRDIAKATSVLVPGGILAFHDYRGGIDPGVDQAVDELLAAGGQMISLTKTLAVVRPPAAIPLEV